MLLTSCWAQVRLQVVVVSFSYDALNEIFFSIWSHIKLLISVTVIFMLSIIFIGSLLDSWGEKHSTHLWQGDTHNLFLWRLPAHLTRKITCPALLRRVPLAQFSVSYIAQVAKAYAKGIRLCLISRTPISISVCALQ